VNTNLENPNQIYEPRGFYTSAGFVKADALKTKLEATFREGSSSLHRAGDSEYKRVMERRKSRQSNNAPTVVDIDYVGDSAKFEHIIRFRDCHQGQPNKQNLNFGMKLRNYKNVTTFNAAQPWIYPPKKAFHPNYVYEGERERVNTTLKNFKESRFNDTSPEKNQGLLLSILDKKFGIYENTFWN
jgi:hypothetical protein